MKPALRWFLLAAVGVFAWCGRWLTISPTNSPWISLDSQDIVLARFLAAWRDGSLGWSELFLREGGSFRVTALLWSLLGDVINSGVWETQWQTWMAMPVMAAMLVIVLGVTADWRNAGHAWLVAAVVACVGYCDMGWINLATGLGVSEYFAITLQLLAMYCWLGPRALGWRWWAGVGLYGMAFLSADSGGLIALAAGGVTLMQLTGQKNDDRRALWAAVILLILGAVWLIQTGRSGQWHTTGVIEFMVSWLEALSYPFVNKAWLVPLLWLPFDVMVWRWWKRRELLTVLDQRLITLALWVILLACMAALADSPSRWGGLQYANGLALGAVVNTAILLRLIRTLPLTFRLSARSVTLQLGWFTLLVLGLWWSGVLGGVGWREGPYEYKKYLGERGLWLHAAISMGNPSLLVEAEKSATDVFDAKAWAMTRQAYGDASLRAALPPMMQRPLMPVRVEREGKAFLPKVTAMSPLMSSKAFGLMPVEGGGEKGRLSVWYDLPAANPYYIIQMRFSARTSGDIAAELKLGDRPHVLWGDGKSLPFEVLLRRKISNLPIMVINRFHVRNDNNLQVTVADSGIQKDGEVSFITPVPIGRGTYLLADHWYEVCSILAGLALASLLWVGGLISWPWRLNDQTGMARNYPRWFWPWVTVAIVGVLFFIRRSDAILNPQFWYEDGSIFFMHAYLRGPASIFEPYSGYSHLVPRLVALVSQWCLPYAYMPHVYNFVAFGMMLTVAASVFSPRLPLRLWQRVAMALTLALVAHPTGEVFMNLTNLQWFGAILLLVVALKASPDRKYGRVWLQWTGVLSVLLVLGLTGPFVIFLLPAYCWRLLNRRDKISVILCAIAASVAGVQLYLMLSNAHLNSPPSVLPEDYGLTRMWAIQQAASLRLARLIFLPGVSQVPLYPIVGSGAILLLVAFMGWVAKDQTRERLNMLVSVGGTLALLLVAAAIRNPDFIYLGATVFNARYFYLPSVFLAWLLILLLPARHLWQSRLVLLVLACMIATSMLVSFVSMPQYDANWAASASKLQAGVRENFPITPKGVYINLQAPAVPVEEHSATE